MDEFHPVVLAADSTDLQANTLSRISDAFTLGAPAAAISGAMSIYNTFLDYAGQDVIETEAAVRRYAGEEIGDYYAEHKAGADLVGFVAGAVLPASLATKGIQLARSGAAVGSFGEALGYTASRKNYWLKEALKETAADGGTVKSILQSSARRKQLGWEVADQALIGTAQELAIVATMNDSPLFDNATAGDFAWNIALGTGLAGTIGGGLGSLAAKGILKNAAREVQAELRRVDTIYDPAQTGLMKGTEIGAYLDNMLTRPDGLETIGFKYQYDGKRYTQNLDIGAPIAAARDKATKVAQQEIAIKFNELAAGDAAVGQAYSNFVLNGIDAARQAGKSPDEIVELLHGYLNNIERIEAVDIDRMAMDARKFYVNLKPTGETATAPGGITSLNELRISSEEGVFTYIIKDQSAPRWKSERNIASADDFEIGRLVGRVRADTIRVQAAELQPEYRGAGHGVAAYANLADEAARLGKKLTSDVEVSESAVRVWEALKGRGYSVVQDVGAKWEVADGTKKLISNKPVFTITAVPAARPSAIDKLSRAFSKERTKRTSQQAYIIADDVTAADLNIVRMDKLGTAKVKDAFKLAPEADAVQLLDGSFRFNPASKKVLAYRETPHTVRMFIDLETGTLSPQTVPVFGDLIKQGKFVNAVDYIAAGSFKQRVSGTHVSKIDAPPLEGSARFAWASKRSISELYKLTGGVVNSNDIPVMQRLVELERENFDTISKFSFREGAKVVPFSDVMSLRAYVEDARLEILQSQLGAIGTVGKASPETRVIAANLGTTREWVEETIGNGFKPLTNNMALREAGILPTEAALTPQNVAVQWNFGSVPKMVPEDAYRMNMGPSHLATMELGIQYQQMVRKNVANNAVNSVLGDDADLIYDLNAFAASGQPLSRSATAEGAGATTFGAANADYGANAKIAVQDLGKNVALVTQRRRDEAIATLAPHVNAIRDNPAAAAELGILTTALRKSPYRYVFDPEGARRLVSTDVASTASKANVSIDEALDLLEGTGAARHSFDINDEAVAEFLAAHAGMNHMRRDKMGTLYNARGLTTVKTGDTPIIYVPPINTVRYPYHAFVRTKAKVGLMSDTGMITAKSEAQLRELAASLQGDFDVFFKADTDNYFKAKGEYDYNLTLNEGAVNSELSRRGKLADFLPETRAENVLEDYLQFHAKGEEKLVRTAAEVRNGQFFAEMKFLSRTYRREAESVTRGIGSRFRSKVADPFGDYIKTALNISKQQEFPLLDSLNEFVDKVGTQAGEAFEKGFRDAKSGLISWDDANFLMEQYGMRGAYSNVNQYLAANERYPRNLIREGLQKANLLLAGFSLRLDLANSLLNIISTPIMLGTELSSIRQRLKAGDPMLGKLNELTSLKVPGQEMRAPTMTPRIADAINNFFGPDKQQLIGRYREIGAIKEISQLYHEVLDDLSFRPDSGKGWVSKIEAGIEKGSKFTGNAFSEELTRFISADVMRQITDPLVGAGKLSSKEQNAYISTFVNRVQGNYVTSQRPVAFQGTTGAAISLFQTYTFNVLQQLHRHMEAGDKKTLLMFAGLQGSIFGLNGLPFFDAVNTHLIGSAVANNPQHNDLYNTLPSFNKELGDWMLYGTASAFPLFSGSSPALYTRGDMNPRHITMIPVNPLDVPAVSASLKLMGTIASTGKNILQGADVTDSLLKGLEHQGINRPLAGFAQLLAGRTTTSQGALISASSDMETTSLMATVADRMTNFGGAARLMGARPMDESIALTTLYRQKQYQAMDRARLERLGEVVKTRLYGGEVPTDEEFEDFALRYARSGGRVENFSQAMQRWSRDANVSVVNQLANKLKSPYGQTLQTIMGGEKLPDYTTQLTEGE